MVRLGKALEAVAVMAYSPDGNIEGHGLGRNKVSVAFTDEEAYEYYQTPQQLARQFSDVVERTIVGLQQARMQVIRDESSLRPVEPGEILDDNRAKYHRELNEVIACGISRRDVLDVESHQLMTWDFEFREAVFDLTAQEVCREVESAIADAFADYAEQRFALKEKYFGRIGALRPSARSHLAVWR